MRLALEMGYERLELALLEAADPESYRDDAWRHNEPPPIPQLSAGEALHLLHLHQKQVRLQAEPPHIRRRRGESREAHSVRLSAMYEAKLQRDREAFNIAEAARRARGEPHLFRQNVAKIATGRCSAAGGSGTGRESEPGAPDAYCARAKGGRVVAAAQFPFNPRVVPVRKSFRPRSSTQSLVGVWVPGSTMWMPFGK